jgi:hypothetical protein
MPHTPGQSDAGSTNGDPTVVSKAAPRDASAVYMQAATVAAVAPEPETALHSMPETANTLKIRSAAAAAAVAARSGRSTPGNRLSRILARWRGVQGVRSAGTALAGTSNVYSAHTLWV